jgi:hypothetical protein
MTVRGTVKRGRGRPAHQPTDGTRAQVANLAAFGMEKERIARLTGISVKTLDKRYKEELDLAGDRVNAMLADSLMAQAVGRPAVYDKEGRLLRAEQPRVPAVSIYMGKVWLKWKPDIVDPNQAENELTVRVVRGGFPDKKY